MVQNVIKNHFGTVKIFHYYLIFYNFSKGSKKQFLFNQKWFLSQIFLQFFGSAFHLWNLLFLGKLYGSHKRTILKPFFFLKVCHLFYKYTCLIEYKAYSSLCKQFKIMKFDITYFFNNILWFQQATRGSSFNILKIHSFSLLCYGDFIKFKKTIETYMCLIGELGDVLERLLKAFTLIEYYTFWSLNPLLHRQATYKACNDLIVFRKKISKSVSHRDISKHYQICKVYIKLY